MAEQNEEPVNATDDPNVEAVHNTGEEASPTNPGGNNPHPVEEDPEEHVGRRRKDPWADDKQTDWPNNDAELDDSGEETNS